MCAPVALLAVAATATAVGGGISAYSQYQNGKSQNDYYNFMASNANTEAGYARAEGEQALKAGELQSKLIQDQAAQQGTALKTSQTEQNASTRAALAANGVYGGVSYNDIINNNVSKERMDELVLRNNADTRSWQATTEASYRNQEKKYQAWTSNIQSDQYKYAGSAAAYAGKVNAFSTLLGTVSSVASLGIGKK